MYSGLALDYWVLDYNPGESKAPVQRCPKNVESIQYWFGPYPFFDDGYKLVDAPYLGMENQSDIAYGNGYQNGYLGKDLSHSGMGIEMGFHYHTRERP